MTRKVKDITGQRFGYLVAKSYAGSEHHGFAMWNVVCDCGAEKVVMGIALRSGATVSCGCYHQQKARGTAKHGHNRPGRRTAEYSTRSSMINRCSNPSNDHYHRYGGRGITVCERWREDFRKFLFDMGNRPGPGYSIDRINNDGNYEPSNCRWATADQQYENRSYRPRRKGKTE